MAIVGLILAVGFCALVGMFILWCCCYVSGECSREEERRERERVSLFEKDEDGDLTFRALPPLAGYWPMAPRHRPGHSVGDRRVRWRADVDHGEDVPVNEPLDIFKRAGLDLTDEQKAEIWSLQNAFLAVGIRGDVAEFIIAANRTKIDMIKLGRAMESAYFLLPVPLNVAFWRWLILWVAVVLLVLWGAS